MKRSKTAIRKEDSAIDMTPMLDIVFIMLIFFIVTTTFANEKGLIGDRPPPSAHTPPQTQSLSISIDENGQIFMLGRAIDSANVIANTQLFLANNTSKNAAIQAHKNTEHGIVVEVMDKVKLAGIQNIQILVKHN